MEQDTVKLYSSVKPSLIRWMLFRALLLAGAGVLLLAYSGSFIPPQQLSVWGIPILLVGGALIYIGMVPYRRLVRVQDAPNELIVIGEKYLQYVERGVRQFSVPVVSIEKIAYRDSGGREYGLAITLKEPLPEKITVHNPRLDILKFQKRSQKRQGCDLFIPYFSVRAYTRLAFLGVCDVDYTDRES